MPHRKTKRAPHLAAGQAAENLALEYLQRHGLQLLARNYRCYFGELDLVMSEGDELIIVEVRYRRRESPVSALVSIGSRKRARILRTAQHYLQFNTARREQPLRFDVVTVTGPQQARRLQWLQGAFDATDLVQG
ncbi:MAG: YraN family protein [Gammaproteobacteria bacterium]